MMLFHGRINELQVIGIKVIMTSIKMDCQGIFLCVYSKILIYNTEENERQIRDI